MIKGPAVDWLAIAPEMTLMVGAFVLLMLAAFIRGRDRGIGVIVGLLVLALSGGFAVYGWNDPSTTTLAGAVQIDQLTESVRVLIAGCGILTLIISVGWTRMREVGAEFAAILLLACAGMDLIAAKEGELAVTEKRGGFGIMEQPPRKPIIAAIEGHALAGGLELALCCDLIVASSDATMGLPEARWALIASGGGLFRLPRRIPYHVAMELALTARPRPATEFHRLGLVNRICEPGGALEAATGLAGEVLRNGPLAIEATAQIMRRSFDMSEEEAWAFQVPFTEQILASADRIEGLTAFAEKRVPVWEAT